MDMWFVVAALIAMNLGTIALFWLDKRYAQNGDRRISESTLLTWAIFGGSPGALLARQLFRHKTRKQPFSTMLYVICVLQIGLLIGWNLA